MARISFTKNIQRHVSCPDAEVTGTTVRAVLDAYFAVHPAARGYVLDDQGAMRHGMVVFVDNRQVYDRVRLSDPVSAASEVHVFQALSGG